MQALRDKVKEKKVDVTQRFLEDGLNQLKAFREHGDKGKLANELGCLGLKLRKLVGQKSGARGARAPKFTSSGKTKAAVKKRKGETTISTNGEENVFTRLDQIQKELGNWIGKPHKSLPNETLIQCILDASKTLREALLESEFSNHSRDSSQSKRAAVSAAVADDVPHTITIQTAATSPTVPPSNNMGDQGVDASAAEIIEWACNFHVVQPDNDKVKLLAVACEHGLLNETTQREHA